MTEPNSINYDDVPSFEAQGRNRFVFKYLVNIKGAKKKYSSLADITKDPEMKKYDLNRQKIYRIRKDSFATTPLGHHKYDSISITTINERRKFVIKQVRTLVD